MSKVLPLPILLVLLAGCAATRPIAAPPPAPTPAGTLVVAEAFVAADQPGEELDSLVAWPAEDGTLLLVATAKTSHRLLVFDGDTGELLRTVGRRGPGPGEFVRPNGVAAHGDLLFVSERDNHRVQVLRLPDFAPLRTFGDDELRSPYGVWTYEAAPGELVVYVTDSFMDGPRHDVVPPFERLAERVRRYRVRLDGAEGLQVESLGAFGETGEDTALRMVESIAGDPANDRLLVADEDRRHLSTLREYTLDGRYTGRYPPKGSFQGEAEGIALWACDADAGYWVVSDQLQPRTVFRVFERGSLAPRGAFSGTVTAWTDGIALHAAGTARFPGGVLYAVHDDKTVTAFDLRDIAEALALDPACR